MKNKNSVKKIRTGTLDRRVQPNMLNPKGCPSAIHSFSIRALKPVIVL